jgi:hypothetical protein
MESFCLFRIEILQKCASRLLHFSLSLSVCPSICLSSVRLRDSHEMLLEKSINFVIIQFQLKPAKCNKHFTWTSRCTYIPRRILRVTRCIRTKCFWNVTPCDLLNMSQTVLIFFAVRPSVLYSSVNILYKSKVLRSKVTEKLKKNFFRTP